MCACVCVQDRSATGTVTATLDPPIDELVLYGTYIRVCTWLCFCAFTYGDARVCVCVCVCGVCVCAAAVCVMLSRHAAAGDRVVEVVDEDQARGSRCVLLYLCLCLLSVSLCLYLCLCLCLCV